MKPNKLRYCFVADGDENVSFTTTCPSCGVTHSAAQRVSCVDKLEDVEKKSQPTAGDITICSECCHPSEFALIDGKLALRELDEAKAKAILNHPQIQAFMEIKNQFKERLEKDGDKIADGYAKLVLDLAQRLRQWKIANPTVEPILQLPPKEVGIISSVSAALKEKFINADENGMRMLQECGFLDDSINAPTVFQLKAALSEAFGDAE